MDARNTMLSSDKRSESSLISSSLKQRWVDHCSAAAHSPASFYASARKILTQQHVVYPRLDSSLTLADCAFTQSKITMLTRLYLNQESRLAALTLWERLRAKRKYGSVSFHTHNHVIKGATLANLNDPRSHRGSIMGPCLQSVVLTTMPPNTYSISAFWRTTEIFKKFPADLVFLRDAVLPPFDIAGLKFGGLHCHFANVTVHPMYAITIFPHIDPLRFLRSLKPEDPHFYRYAVHWCARYLCPEHRYGADSFAQAKRVGEAARRVLNPKIIAQLQTYIRRNHHKPSDLDGDEE